MSDGPSTHERALSVIRSAVATFDDSERVALRAWAEELLRIREGNFPVAQKARMALAASARSEVAHPLIRVLARESRELGIRSKKILWDDRGWAARIGLAGVTLGATVLGGEGAGIAALGGAIGVPLWLVLGAGGALLGTMLEELNGPRTPTTTYTIIEAHRTDPNDGA